MSFRLKTILGIALIEAVLLAVLVVLGVRGVQQIGRSELATRADTTAKLAEAMVADALVATDLGALHTFAESVAATEGVSYVRIVSGGRVMASAGNDAPPVAGFEADAGVDLDSGQVYDVARDVVIGGQVYGQLQLGLDTVHATALADETRQRALAVAALELVLVAAFSWVLGTYLTRQLTALRAGAARLADGDFSQPIPLRGNDEVTATGAAFNSMMQRLRASDVELRHALQAQTESTRQLREQGELLQRQRAVTASVSEVQRAYIEGRSQEETCRAAIVQALQLTGAGCAFLAELAPHGIDSGQGRAGAAKAPMRLTVEAHVACPAASWDEALDGFCRALARAVGDADHLLLAADHIDDPVLAQAAAGLPFKSLLALPVRLGERVVALLCLAGGDRPLDAADAQGLQPLLDTVAQLMGVYDSEARRQQAAAAAQRLLAELDAIFSLSPDGFAFFDAEARLTVCNPALEALLGQAPGALAGRSLAAFDALLRSLGAEAGTARDGMVDTLTLQRPRPRVLQRAVRAVRGADGGTPGHVLYLRDVTHESEVDRMKTDFLSTAAHELRTPMASIHGFAELLLSRSFDEATQRELIDTIHRQSQALVTLVNELLDLARIEARVGKDLAIGRGDVEPLVRSAVAALARPGAAHRFLIESAPALPAVDVDPAKFGQVLTNVLSNAVKYSPGGGEIRLRAEPALHDGREGVALHVCDPGIGMTAEQLGRVFERFYRADTSGAIPGTGLGMSLVREIMHLHGGDVWLASAPGTGTTVTLWLPCSREADAVAT